MTLDVGWVERQSEALNGLLATFLLAFVHKLRIISRDDGLRDLVKERWERFIRDYIITFYRGESLYKRIMVERTRMRIKSVSCFDIWRVAIK